MYKLYGALGGASLAPHCVLEKSGLPYEFIKVNISRDTERDPEYLKLNPHGRIPTLVFDDQVIIESAAISIYLADKHSHTQLSLPWIIPTEPAISNGWFTLPTPCRKQWS